jgi:alpha/beta hydrolase fold.
MMKKNGIFSRIAVFLLAFALAFAIYASVYYRADDEALNLYETASGITTQDGVIELKAEGAEEALIFYPGAKVEAIAYLPLLVRIRNKGITVYLTEMPLNMAIFDENAADKVIKNHPEIKTWYLAGHSMGGAMASSFASKHQEEIAYLFLLGAYPYKDFPAERTLSIYGTLNESVEKKLTVGDRRFAIEGGNHAQFGSYGRQRGDKDALIAPEEQQMEAVNAMMKALGR